MVKAGALQDCVVVLTRGVAREMLGVAPVVKTDTVHVRVFRRRIPYQGPLFLTELITFIIPR